MFSKRVDIASREQCRGRQFVRTRAGEWHGVADVGGAMGAATMRSLDGCLNGLRARVTAYFARRLLVAARHDDETRA
jgi:hypothetical protein